MQPVWDWFRWLYDATGINLCTFGDVEHFVNDVLANIGYGPVRNNGV